MCDACTYWKSEAARNKDFRQGAINPDRYDEEVNYRPRKKAKKSVQKYPGCPGNEGKAHVYVWTTEREIPDMFSDYFGFFKYQSRICAGCGKKNGRKYSEQYEARKRREWDKRYVVSVKRGEPVPRRRYHGPNYRWWNWENHIDDFVQKRREYIARRGWTNYIYGF